MEIEKIKNNKTEKIMTAYLEGILMPNGDFIHMGKLIRLQKEDRLYKNKD